MLDNLALVVTGLGALIAAVAGVLLVVHSVRGNERKASGQEITELSEMLDAARAETLAAKKNEYRMRQWLVEHGIDYPNGKP